MRKRQKATIQKAVRYCRDCGLKHEVETAELHSRFRPRCVECGALLLRKIELPPTTRPKERRKEMGLKQQSSAAKWVSLSKGMFRVKNGDHFEEYPAFEGVLTGIRFSDKTMKIPGKPEQEYRQLTLTFGDGNDQYKIGIDSSNGYARAIMAKLANIEDFSHPIELVPTYDESSKKSGCFVNCGGMSIRQAWTKDHRPDGMPDVETSVFKGKTQYDFSAQEKWIEEYLMAHVAPKLAANASKFSAAPKSADLDGGDSDEGGEPVAAGVDEEAVPF